MLAVSRDPLSAGVNAARRVVAVTVAYTDRGYPVIAAVRGGKAVYSQALHELTTECGGVQEALAFLKQYAKGVGFTRAAVQALDGRLEL